MNGTRSTIERAGADTGRHPRVSPTAKRWVGVVLTGIWIVGLTILMEILHTGWWAPIALLVVVLVAELAFVRWNEGRWPVGTTAGDRDEPNTGPGGPAG